MEMVALVKKIDELKEIMAACNVNHVVIDAYNERDDKGNVTAKFVTNINQDERVIVRPGRYYGGYRHDR